MLYFSLCFLSIDVCLSAIKLLQTTTAEVISPALAAPGACCE